MKMRKLLTCVMALVISLSAFTGCIIAPGEQVNKDQSQLNVGIFLAGLGTKWLEEAKEDFEAYYAETSFEEGKKGVQIIIDPRTEEFKPSNLVTTMPYNENAIYFLDQADYSLYRANDLLEDLTATVNEKIYDEDGNFAKDTGKPAVNSIVSTMNDEFQGRYQEEDGYFAIPYRVNVSGIMYDADLFNQEGYYFYNDKTMGAKQADIDLGVNGDIGPGPDGVVGTNDDGMPETWKDFVKLMKQIAEDDYIPFTWSGGTHYQRWYAYESIWANYQGLQDYKPNLSFSGELSDGTVVTEQNYNSTLIDQEGRKAAITVFKDIMSNPKYYSANAMTQSYTAAEFEYIDSISNGKRIAFFMEGGYWESEAREYFDTAAIIDENLGYGKRDFRLLPIPNFVGDERVKDQPESTRTENEVLLGRGAASLVCIPKTNGAANPELQKQLAKLFLQFVNSRQQLSKFVANTGACFRPFSFTATEDELKEYTKFGKNVYKYMEEGSTILSDLKGEQRQNVTGTTETKWAFYVRYDGKDMGDPATLFNKYPSLSVDQVYTLLKAELAKC